MTYLTYEIMQGEMVNSIEFHVESAAENIEEATHETVGALKYAEKARRVSK